MARPPAECIMIQSKEYDQNKEHRLVRNGNDRSASCFGTTCNFSVCTIAIAIATCIEGSKVAITLQPTLAFSDTVANHQIE